MKNVLIKALNYGLGSIEKSFLYLLRVSYEVPNIWIIGPPRSGTTLLYQVLLKRYKFAYISNFASVFYKAPILATGIAHILFNSRDAVIEFESDYGKTSNWLGPHEAGAFWYRWFPKGDYVYVPPNALSQNHLKLLKREVIGLGLFMKAPVLFKNVYNSMRIAPIVETFPNACFLVCNRDPLDSAQSILNGRAKFYNDKSEWLSVPPKEVEQIRQHPYWQQVTEQVYYIYQQIDEDKQRYGTNRFLEIDYGQLCKSTHKTLQEIEEFLVEHSIELMAIDDVPEQFPFSTGQKVNDKDYHRIREVVTQLWQR
ncbi:MAG TPA: sulfotransferase [Chloroflexi bacterium]|nr:sulfotransferase [Chloroflexota bacterium]